MGLEIFNDIINKVKESDFVQNFIEELTDYLKNKGEVKVESNSLKQEGTLYQVVDFSSKGVYLRNTENNKIFEETNINEDLKEKLGNDYVLSYKNGKYVYEEELTDKFMNSLVDIGEYQKIKSKFENKTNILEIDKNEVFKVEERKENTTILGYGNNEKIEVPNELIPFFSKTEQIYLITQKIPNSLINIKNYC